jgi:hypothetical protein
MGQAYQDVLPPHYRTALQAGTDWLIEQGFNDLMTIDRPGSDVRQTSLADCLPDRYLLKYTPLFMKQFFVCILTVAWKLAQPSPTYLACLAEEMAAWAIIQEAEAELEQQGEEADFDPFIEDLFEDTDFLQLFDDANDGIEETELGKVMGMTSLAFKDWFVPFRGHADVHYGAVHPYVDQDTTEGRLARVEGNDTADE